MDGWTTRKEETWTMGYLPRSDHLEWKVSRIILVTEGQRDHIHKKLTPLSDFSRGYSGEHTTKQNTIGAPPYYDKNPPCVWMTTVGDVRPS